MLFKTKYQSDYTIQYILIHFLQGSVFAIDKIPYNYKLLWFFIILIYQLGQLYFNVRYFCGSNKLLKGNSVQHTLNKFIDYIIGYFIAYFISYFISYFILH